MKMPSPATRKWLYGIANAGVAIAVVYGVVNGVEAAAWGLLINAVLGLAQANVPPTAKHIQHEEIF